MPSSQHRTRTQAKSRRRNARGTAESPIPFKPTALAAPETIEPHVGPIVAPLVVGPAGRLPSREHAIAEAFALAEFTAEPRPGLEDDHERHSLGTLLRLELFDGATDAPAAFLRGLGPELEVLRMASRSEFFDAQAVESFIDGLQRRARLTLALNERFKRAERARVDRKDPPVALPEPAAVVDALLALPGVFIEGSSPLRTLDRMLRKIGCRVLRDSPEAEREIGKRSYVFRCYPETLAQREGGDVRAPIAFVAHDATNAERLAYFPEFVAQALAIREGFVHAARGDWNGAVVAELRRRLGIADALPVASSKGAAA